MNLNKIDNDKLLLILFIIIAFFGMIVSVIGMIVNFNKNENYVNKKIYDKITDFNYKVKIFCDKKTNLQYFIIKDNNGISMIPRYTKDSKTIMKCK